MDSQNNINNPSQDHLIILGETNFRNQKWRFGIKPDDRRRHMYVIGSTGMGKSEFLKNMAIQDINSGRGLAFIDPHGDPADDLLDHIPAHRIKDVIYFDPSDLEYPIAFNVMEKVEYDYRHLVTSGLLGVFKKIWGTEAWSGRMEYILNNTILALLEHPDSTLLGINRLMSSKGFRKKIVSGLKDPIVKSFWVDEFAKYADRFATEATAAIQNKVGQFSSNNVIRNIVGQFHSKFDIRKIMDEGKILIVNVSKGKIGEDASRLIGALLITKIQLAAMSRVDMPEKERRDFYLYVDEFQSFATESFANILSEARKFHLCLTVAHQYIKQMEEPVRDAVFGNVGTIVSFRVGAEDAEYLEKWFSPDFLMTDILALGKYNMYLKLMIDGISSKGFSALAIPPIKKPEISYRHEIVAYSRQTYGVRRAEVEESIANWSTSVEDDDTRESESRNREQPRRQQSSSTLSEARYSKPQSNSMPRRDFVPTETVPNRDSDNHRPSQNPRRENTNTQNNFNDRSRSQQNYSRPDNNPRSEHQVQLNTKSNPVSLGEALKTGPVDFRGKKIDQAKESGPVAKNLSKSEIDLDGLRKLLEDMGKKE